MGLTGKKNQNDNKVFDLCSWVNAHVMYWMKQSKKKKRITNILCGHVKFKIPRKP